MRKPKAKPLSLKPRKNFDFNTKSVSDAKVTQLGIHLETLFDRGVNFRDRIITLTGEVEEPMFDLVDAALSEMESDSRKAVTIRINSPGGSTYEALAIIGRLKASKCKIITEGYGHIMSAATLILACGDERRISTYSWFMTHEASYEVTGKHKEIKNTVAQVEREETQWAKWMEQFTKKDEKFWKKVASDRDAYYSPEELLELGVIDEII